jgi:pyruvate dehydrogenase E2 component (dihydrolipoamide acetyltransferase)
VPDIAMPRLSDSMEEGTILKWLKSAGDEVKRGEELVEIETDKANMTYEADQDGVLAIVAQEGDTLPVGEVIASIGGGSGGDGGSAPAAEAPAAAPQAEEAPQAAPQAAEAEPARGGNGRAAEAPASAPAPAPAEPGAPAQPAPSGNGLDRVKASPVARRMAREMGLELAGLRGTGPGGRIVKADVEAAASGGGAQAAPAPQAAPAAAEPAAPEQPQAAPAPPPPPAPVAAGDAGTAKGETRIEELSKTQQVIARRMAESKATAPDFELWVEVDMENAVALRDQIKAGLPEGEKPPSYNDIIVKACAVALREFPRANGAYKDGHFELYSRVNIGIAVAAHDALIVPTIFDADRKSIREIAADARALAERVRAGVITPPELSGGTFAVSNLGMYGIKSFIAVINPPQAAILSVGAMEPRAAVVDGEVTVRRRMDIVLSCDHRILYGADAAEFVRRIKQLLEQPLLML